MDSDAQVIINSPPHQFTRQDVSGHEQQETVCEVIAVARQDRNSIGQIVWAWRLDARLHLSALNYPENVLAYPLPFEILLLAAGGSRPEGTQQINHGFEKSLGAQMFQRSFPEHSFLGHRESITKH